jgi:hypothetical protein
MQARTRFGIRSATGSWGRTEPKGVSLDSQLAAHCNFLLAEWGEIRLHLSE